MRIHEISSDFYTFIVTVRVICGAASLVVKTRIEAESQNHAQALLCHIYGASNVLSVVQQSVNEDGTKILSPDEQRVKTMSDQAKRLQQQAKQIKAQSAVKKAQTQVNKALKQSTGLPS
jgi:DNA integrity scanning protein DisA with diadenylate cyclase activity